MSKIGRKPKKIDPDTDEVDFISLERYFTENERKNLLVDALNELDPIDRNLLIDLVKCGTLKQLSIELNCSQQIVRKKIKEIRNKIKIIYDKKLNSNE